MRADRCIVPVLILGATLCALPAAAQSDKAKSKNQAGKEHGQAAHHKAAPASDVEIRLIRGYYTSQGAKPKPLPPGIAKNLARGKPLPPGIAKTRLPEALVVQLPARPDHQWVLAGDVVVLIDPVGIVVDILREIF